MKLDWKVIEEKVLSQLKPFQRRTVEWAFSRLYPNDTSMVSGRFLVADEVGLGKTLIAKGIMVKALRHLESQVKRIDIVYVCSNRDIARQNLARLRIEGLGDADFVPHDRLTLLPLVENWHDEKRTTAFRRSGVNMISLTPGTSLELSGGTGLARERALILLMLQAEYQDISETRLLNMLHFPSKPDNFKREVEVLRECYLIDQSMQSSFNKALKKNRTLVAEIYELSESFARKRINIDGAEEPYVSARRLVGQLRQVLASVCIDALEPDLIILDEFQRFSHLLTPNDEQVEDAELAQSLFAYSNKHNSARILLISATPYQMFSVTGEQASQQHYLEFLKATSFLLDDNKSAQEGLETDLNSFNTSLFSLHDQTDEQLPKIVELRKRIEERLRNVMVRTDRVNATEDRDGMINTIAQSVIPNASDVVAYAGLQRIASELEQPDLLEYWRSAPYPLSFLSGYGLHQNLVNTVSKNVPSFQRLLKTPGVFLTKRSTKRTNPDNLPNARLRRLVADLLGAGMARMLWIPPSLPYYALGGPYSGLGDAARTKRLIFSSWRMVPRALSVLVSEAFVNAVEGMYRKRYGSNPRNMKDLLKFSDTGGGAFALRYPCWTFALQFDQRKLCREVAEAGKIPSYSTMVDACAKVLAPQLSALKKYQDPENTSTDKHWYWFAPLLLDLERFGPEWKVWFDPVRGKPHWLVGSEAEKVISHLSRTLQSGKSTLGRMPDDLPRTMAALALAGPGVCAMRSIRELSDSKDDIASLASAAAGISSHFQTYFNTHDSAVLIRAVAVDHNDHYWRQVLWYCGEGCLQSVIDEYVHVLLHDKPHKPPKDKTEPQHAWDTIAECFSISLGLRPAVLVPDVLETDSGNCSLLPVPTSARQARPLLEDRHESEKDGPTSTARLRDAFNSPFLPFVLSSTSIGQEGLDFHWYCHAIVHWNLPWNPIDFEQRDGRIHRFKNHAVRKNLAADVGFEVLHTPAGNPWGEIFRLAEERLVGRDMDGMKPCWLYLQGELQSKLVNAGWFAKQLGSPAKIERHIPMIPCSHDGERYDRLQKSLAAYRLVFGQPRQEDMLRYLHRHFSPEQLEAWVGELAINLRPA